MEEAGELTNHQEGPDMDCCPRSELTVARHETVRILGADAHMKRRLWYIVHGCSELSRITYQPSRRTLVHIQVVLLTDSACAEFASCGNVNEMDGNTEMAPR